MATRGTNDKKKQRKQVKEFANIYQDAQDKVSEMDQGEKLKLIQEAMKDKKITKNLHKEMKDRLSQSFIAQKEAQEEMENAAKKSLMAKMFGIGKNRTDDGDQSPVRGTEAHKLKFMWASGMDWNPDSPFASPWMKILSNGDIDAMLGHINNKTDEEIRHQLELRETELNFSALFHVCKGAMTTNETSQPTEFKPKHVECLCKLLDLGANIHARDFAGFTPLHYCVTKYASPTSLKLAKILLKRGADPNAVNREPVMGMRTDCVKLLLDYGADPTIDDVSARMQRGVFGKDDDDKNVSLMLYDEKKTVVGEIEEDEPSYKSIVEKIHSEGVYGDKGFFYAILDKKKNLKINTTKILPPEIW